MALLSRISTLLCFTILFVMIPNSTSSYEFIREKRNPTLGILQICTEEKMKWKFTCILCKGYDPSCYTTSSNLSSSTTSTTTTTPSSSSSSKPSSTSETTSTTTKAAPAGEERSNIQKSI